jgi:hypothetical protein
MGRAIQQNQRINFCPSGAAAVRHNAGADGRARGLIQYHGATTGRDSGRLLQPQNFPRGKVEFGKDENGEEIPPWDVLVPAIQTCDPDVVRVLLGGVCPIDAVSAALRHNIVAAPGKPAPHTHNGRTPWPSRFSLSPAAPAAAPAPEEAAPPAEEAETPAEQAESPAEEAAGEL